MKPLVIDYLSTHSLRELEEERGVCARPSKDGSKFSCNYDQIFAKSGDPIAEQCRGLIIRPGNVWFLDAMQTYVSENNDKWKDCRGPWEILAWPMNRFYNFGDTNAADIDWNDPNLKVFEKVDGTCIILYWDPLHEKWHAGTRSVPEADLPIYKGHIEIGDTTFSQLFLKALIATREELSGQKVDWEVDGPDKVIHLNKEMTYVFELVSPYNQIVVNYPEPRVYLLAARHTATGQEVNIDSLRIQHARRPQTWALKDPVAVGAFVNTLDPSQFEGTVVCDSKFRRMKIKSMAYVLAHKSKDTLTASPRNALEAIILEQIDDVIPLVPKDVGDKMLKMQGAYAQYVKSIDDNFTRYKEQAVGSRKHFAEQVLLSNDWSAPYFNLWEGRAPTAREWIKKTAENKKLATGALDIILSKLAL